MSNLPNTRTPGQLHVNAEGFIVRDHAPHPTRSAIVRFFEKVRVSSIVSNGANGPCWDWIGCKSRNGYGQFKVDARRGSTRKTGPHVYAYEYFVGAIPDGFEVHHLCYVRHCCNPLHLALMSHRDNVTDADSITPPAINAQKTECSRGHSLSGSNLHIKPNGSRQCRACNALRQREFQAKRKARITNAGDATESSLSDAPRIRLFVD